MRTLPVLAVVVLFSACGGSSEPRSVPSSIEITTSASGTALAGLPIPMSPSFVVRDQSGNAMAGVPVTIAVTGGAGSLANAPSASTAQPTSVGTWTLGRTVGINTLSISVSGVTPTVISVSSSAGNASQLVATSPTNLVGTVGQPVNAPISVMSTDAFGNAVGGVALSVTTSAGGSAVSSVTTDAGGAATIPTWTLGTVKGPYTLTITFGTAGVTFSAAAAAGPVQSLTVLSGDNQSSLAGATLSQPVILAPLDQFGNRVDNQVAIVSVLAGGGRLAASTASSSADGTITMPAFTLGRSALPQSAFAAIGFKAANITANVLSNYAIDIRFWGSPMTASQQALFTNAAARIRGIISGSVPTVDATRADPSLCGVTGVPVLAESVPGVIIYASVQAIDGPGGVLAQAGPCYTRDTSDLRTVVGVMEFDEADLSSLSASGSLQDVITHEMLHVVGFGVFWDSEGLLTNFNTATVGYVGAGGLAGCRATGGINSCASAVPVENTGGPGTANSHWRESTFGSELMTGFVNTGTMPLSLITVRSLGDLGYTINPLAADPYTIFVGSIRASGAGNLISPPGVVWERTLPRRPVALPLR